MPSWGGAAKGAGTGAAVGSVIPGVGTVIGGGVGALIGGLFSHGKPKAADGSDLSADGSDGSTPTTADQLTKTLTDQSAKLSKRGDQLGASGDNSMKLVTDYFSKLVGGDEQALLDATKVERGRVINQYDTARNAITQFGPRGGGSTSASAYSRISEANELSDVTASARTNAADKLTGIGATEQGLGLSADQLASGDIGQVLQSLFGQEQLDAQKSGQKSANYSALAQGIGTILALYLTRKK